jgi:heat shock protein HslJ
MRQVVMIVLTLLLLNGCGRSVGGDQHNELLVGQEWRLIAIGGTPALAGSDATLRFSADGQVSGSGSINRYNGSYTIEGARLTIGALVRTEMAGPPERMQQEAEFLGLLASARSFQVTGNTLTISGDGGTLTLAS